MRCRSHEVAICFFCCPRNQRRHRCVLRTAQDAMKLIKITIQDVDVRLAGGRPINKKLSKLNTVYLAENGRLNTANDYVNWYKQNPDYIPVEQIETEQRRKRRMKGLQ